MSIIFPCPKAIETMRKTDSGYECDYCDKPVFDFSGIKLTDIPTGHCSVVDLNKSIPHKGVVNRFALAAVVIFGASLFSFGHAQTADIVNKVKTEMLVGEKSRSLALLTVNLKGSKGRKVYGAVVAVLPNGKEMELIEAVSGEFVLEVPSYCLGKEILIISSYHGKTKEKTLVFDSVLDHQKVNFHFKVKQFRRIVAGSF